MFLQTDGALNRGLPFAKLYGCYFYSLLAVVEAESEKEISIDMVYRIFGESVHRGGVYHASYANHKKPFALPKEWNERSDPEYHFYVAAPALILEIAAIQLDCVERFQKSKIIKSRARGGDYSVVRYLTKYGGHFVLERDNLIIYNPDPTLALIGIKSSRNIYFDR